MPDRADTIRIGLRNLTRNTRRSLLTGSMVALGVAALIFFRGYISSLREGMIEMVVNSLTSEIQVDRRGASESLGLPPLDLDLPADLEATIERAAAGITTAPRIRFGAFLINGEKSSLVGVLAVDPAREKKVAPLGPGAGRVAEEETAGGFGIDGQGIASVDDDTLVLGVGLAKGLGIKKGDTVSLLARTQKGSTDAIDGVVRGLARTGDPELNKRLVLMSLRSAQRLLHMNGRVTAFAIATPHRSLIPQVVDTLKTALTSLEPPTEVRPWQQLAPYYRDVVTLQNNIMNMVMGMVFILVLAGIVNTMMMSVYERQREIGTLMALGFRRRTIVFLFLIEAMGLGAIAATIGAIIGMTVVIITNATGIPFTIPAVGTINMRPLIDAGYAVFTVVVAMTTALLAGLYPAYRASRLQPVEALRAV